MRKHVGTTVLVFGAVLGLALVGAVKTGWGNYLLDRCRYGATVSIEGRCINLPSRWTVFPGGQGGFQDIRRHFGSGDSVDFASVVSSKFFWQASLKDIDSGRDVNSFKMYELDLRPEAGSLRYMAVSENLAVAVLASRGDLLEELVAGISSCR